MDIAAQEQSQREQKIGRRTVLLQQQENLRINIDAVLQAMKDAMGVRDVEFTYVEKVDYKKLKILLNESTIKDKELIRVNKEIAALNAALGETE